MKVKTVSSRDEGKDPIGAYGLTLLGVPEAGEYLVRAPASWPAVTISLSVSNNISGLRDGIGSDQSVLLTESGGSLVMKRAERHVVITTPEPLDPSAIAHPYLTPVGTMFARWDGRESFHAGGIVIGDSVWGLVGERGRGKSSLVALWVENGGEGFCDDVLVVSGGKAAAGPRLIDLHEAAATQLGLDEDVVPVDRRGKVRLLIGTQTEPEMPLGGWVFLEWGDTLECQPVPASETLVLLAKQRGILLRPDSPHELLKTAAYPAFRLRRPKSWSAAQESLKLLEHTIRAQIPPAVKARQPGRG